MELKQHLISEEGNEEKVLIVPDGIETSKNEGYSKTGYVLIVPDGIETMRYTVRKGLESVLIVPDGIETHNRVRNSSRV